MSVFMLIMFILIYFFLYKLSVKHFTNSSKTRNKMHFSVLYLDLNKNNKYFNYRII